MGLAVPEHAHWPPAPTGPAQCVWACDAGFERAGGGGLCCSTAVAGYGVAGREWRPSGCSQQCKPGLFSALADGPCVPCAQYLWESFGIDFCQRCGSRGTCCDGRAEPSAQRAVTDNSTCTVSVVLPLLVYGITSNDFLAIAPFQAFLLAVSGVIGRAVTVQAVVDVPVASRVRRAAGAVRIIALLPGVDPLAAARLSEEVMVAQKPLEDAVSLALWLADVKALSPAVVASPSAFTCAVGFVLSSATETCCTARDAIPAAGVDPARVMWTNSCSWECLPPYVRYDRACLACSERNALAPATATKPSNAVWDDSGTSQDCTGWTCQPGFIMQSDGSSCWSYSVLLLRCSIYSRCAMCAADADCVWCGSGRGCVPGRPEPVNRTGCAYLPDGSGLSRCNCEPAGCPNECTANAGGCSACLQDSLCGWCGGAGVCQLDLNALPTRAAKSLDAAGRTKACPGGWIPYAAAVRLVGGAATACPPEENDVWVVVLISACVGTVTFGIACIFLLFRFRVLGPPTAPRPAPLPGRLLDDIPTFKYAGRAHNPTACPPPTPPPPAACEAGGVAAGEDEDEEEAMCSICLGEYEEGEELRLLGCLHVFHRQCVDQWLTVSRECPLCKRDVAVSAASADPATINSAAFAARQGRAYDAAAAAFVQRRRRRAARCRCFGSQQHSEDEPDGAAAAAGQQAGRLLHAATPPLAATDGGSLQQGLRSLLPMAALVDGTAAGSAVGEHAAALVFPAPAYDSGSLYLAERELVDPIPPTLPAVAVGVAGGAGMGVAEEVLLGESDSEVQEGAGAAAGQGFVVGLLANSLLSLRQEEEVVEVAL